jgi:hypothetical protein
VLAGHEAVIPKDTATVVESIRVLRVARDGAVKTRTAALNQLKDLFKTAPTNSVPGCGVRHCGRSLPMPHGAAPTPLDGLTRRRPPRRPCAASVLELWSSTP